MMQTAPQHSLQAGMTPTAAMAWGAAAAGQSSMADPSVQAGMAAAASMNWKAAAAGQADPSLQAGMSPAGMIAWNAAAVGQLSAADPSLQAGMVPAAAMASMAWNAAAASQAATQPHTAWAAQGYSMAAAPVRATPTTTGQPSVGQVQVAMLQAGLAVHVQRLGCAYWLTGHIVHVHANGNCGVRYEDGSFEDGVPPHLIRAREVVPGQGGAQNAMLQATATQAQGAQQVAMANTLPPPPAHASATTTGPAPPGGMSVAAPPHPSTPSRGYSVQVGEAHPSRPSRGYSVQIGEAVACNAVPAVLGAAQQQQQQHAHLQLQQAQQQAAQLMQTGHAAPACMPAGAIVAVSSPSGAAGGANIAAAAAAANTAAARTATHDSDGGPFREDTHGDWSGSGSEDEEGVVSAFFNQARAVSQAATAKARKMATASWWKDSLLEPVLQRIADVKVEIDVAADGRDGARDAHLDGLSNEYSEEDIGEATNGFDRSCLLGSGACGSVYKGAMKDGSEVAIKMLKNPTLAGFDEEVKVLSRFRHPNLVILMGFARHPATGSRSLVYEFLSGGDVSGRIQRCRMGKQPFEAALRLSVALDAASGLSHMHNANPRAFHRDIKCPNILLDKNGTAKMADFGLACVSSSASHKVHLASGTAGYACPEYVRTGVVTEGSEVHSFGMVLLELLTGVPPAVMKKDNKDEVEFLIQRLNRSTDKVLELLDVGAHFPEPLARTLTEISWLCIRRNLEERPLFVQLVEALRALVNEPGEVQPEAVSRLFAPPDAGSLIEATLDANIKVAPCEMEGNLSTVDANVRVAPARPEVCSLSCVFASGVDLAVLDESHRTLQFRDPSQDFVIGRTAQAPSLWLALVPEERMRNMISREHIRITSRREQSEVADVFFLECLSPNGVLLNDTFVAKGAAGKQIQNGDVIGFLEIDNSSAGGSSPSKGDDTLSARNIASSAARRPLLAFTFKEYLGHPSAAQAQSELPVDTVAGKWWSGDASLAVPDNALFGLEAQGENVYMDLPREARQLYLCSSNTSLRLPSLRVGRHYQRGFWRMVLKSEYYAEGCWAFVSADHFEIHAWQKPSDNGSGFVVRILSSVGVLLNNTFMGPGDECELQSGDVLSLGGIVGPTASSSDGGLKFVFVPYASAADLRSAMQCQRTPTAELEEAQQLPELELTDDWSPMGRLEAEPTAKVSRSSSGLRAVATDSSPPAVRPAVGGAGVLMLPLDIDLDDSP